MFKPVAIPTNQSFLKQWHPWITSKVSRKFKRDKERIPDAAQNVRVRLLSKDFIGRWFYKHLTDELVDKSQAEYILGGSPITFIGNLLPVEGKRTSPNALWRVSDVLAFAKFDYYRFYYSIQNHTIDSDSVLRLLGYPAGSYGILESLYRQNRLKPAELTEHECIEVLEDPKKGATCSFVDSDGEKCERKHFCRGYCTQHYGKHILVPCPACVRGKELLKARGISLAHRWTEPDVAAAVARLRWNDGQLKPFLRSWRRQNIVQNTPLYVMREANKDGIPAGVDAGLLKYAEMVINHEVVNDFKRISRGDDMSMMVFNKGLSPDMGDDETVAWESDDMSDDPSARQRVFRDVTAHIRYEEMETHRDLAAIVAAAGLTSEESEVIQALDIQEMTVREYADLHGKNIQRVNRVRVSAFRKLRDHRAVVSQTISDLDQLMRDVCEKHGCTPEQVLGPDSFGPAVRARTDLCTSLSDAGLPLSDISSRLGLSEARVAAALNRSVLRDMRRPTV